MAGKNHVWEYPDGTRYHHTEILQLTPLKNLTDASLFLKTFTSKFSSIPVMPIVDFKLRVIKFKYLITRRYFRLRITIEEFPATTIEIPCIKTISHSEIYL